MPAPVAATLIELPPSDGVRMNASDVASALVVAANVTGPERVAPAAGSVTVATNGASAPPPPAVKLTRNGGDVAGVPESLIAVNVRSYPPSGSPLASHVACHVRLVPPAKAGTCCGGALDPTRETANDAALTWTLV